MTLWLPVGFFGSAAVFFAVLLVRAILADLRGRGEVAETFDDHADEAVRVSRDYPTTPGGRRFSADVERWLRKESSRG